MKHLKFIVAIATTGCLFIMLLISCNKDFKNIDKQDATSNDDKPNLTRSGQATVLGKEIPMYCNIAKVKTGLTAFKALKGLSNSGSLARGGYPDVRPNFKYVRFLPKDEDELIDLDETGMDLTDEPMHFEVERPGDYYQDPSIDDSAITWMYTVVPIDYELPKNIETEVISEVFLFNIEPEELEPDEYEDSYIDDNGGTNCYGSTPFIREGKIMACEYSKRSQLLAEAYDWLAAQGIDADEFELYLMHEAGYHGDDYGDEERSGETQGHRRRYRPEGNIRAEDNSVGGFFPVKGVMVKSRNFLKIKRGYTDANGHFKLDRPYRKRAQIIVKWKNRGAVTRGIDNWLKVWDLIFPIKHKLGWFQKNDLENINQNYGYDANHRTLAAERWSACHYMNSLWEVYESSGPAGIPLPPNKMRVYIVERWFNGNAFTPMFSQVYGRGFPISEFNDLLQLKLGRAIKGALRKLLLKNAPDIFLPNFTDAFGPRQTDPASDFINTSYHETGHAIHFAAVGASYWKSFTYPAYGFNLVVYGGDYGPKTGPNADFIAVTEMWGYYYGITKTIQKYQGIATTGNASADNIRRTQLNHLENNIPDDNTSLTSFPDRTFSWIPFGFLHDMTDVGEQPFTTVRDRVSLYNMQRVFTGMAAGSTTICGYTFATLAANNNLEIGEVGLMLDSYRWGGCCIGCRETNLRK